MFNKKQANRNVRDVFASFSSNSKHNASIAKSNMSTSKFNQGNTPQLQLNFSNFINQNHKPQTTKNNPPQHYIEQDQISETSSLSFYEYRQILNNLLENGENDQQWNRLPEIVKLIIKALKLSINTLQNKIIQNRQIINDQGLKTNQNCLQLQAIRRQLKKSNQKVNYLLQRQQSVDQNNTQQHHQAYFQQVHQQNATQSKGLDVIMIEQVKTLTDAIFSKKSEQMFNEIQNIQQKFELQNRRQLQKLKAALTHSINSDKLQQLQSSANEKTQNLQRMLKQRMLMLQMQSINLKKQLKYENNAIFDLGKFIQNELCSKSEFNQLLKCFQQIKHSRTTSHTQNKDTRRKDIQSIVTDCFQKNSFLKKKQFDQFKQKMLREIASYANIQQVQNIINKVNNNKFEKIEQINRGLLKNALVDSQEAQHMKKNKSHQIISTQNKSNEKVLNKNKKENNTQTIKGPYNKLELSKVSKKTQHTKKTSTHQDHFESADVDNFTTKKRNNNSPDLKKSIYHGEPQNQIIVLMQTKMKKMISQLTKKMIEDMQKLNRKVTSRLQIAQQEFCLVVEQNWKKMDENKLKIAKTEKENIGRLLEVFSVLNVIARYSTLINSKKNDCIRWQRQVVNSVNGAFTQNGQKTHIYITSPGIYHFQVVIYSLYDPYVSFAVQINSEQIYNNMLVENLCVQQKTLQPTFSGQNDKKSKILKEKSPHPSRGIQFCQTLLIPAKSHIAIRLLGDLSGQGFLQIRKM